MTEAEKELDEMKAFATSAGCMTIEHISSSIRHARLATTKSEVRRQMRELKHYVDIFIEDFNLNFPKGKKDADNPTP